METEIEKEESGIEQAKLRSKEEIISVLDELVKEWFFSEFKEI